MQFNKPFWASFGGASAIFAGLAVGWGYIRAGCRWLSLLVVGRAIVKDTAGAAVMAYAVGRSKKSPICLRVFGGVDSYVHPKRWNETVGYEAMSPDPVLIKFNGHYALVRTTTPEHNAGIGEVRNFALTVTVFYLRGFFDMEGFVVAALDYHNAQKRNNDPDCPIKGTRPGRIDRTIHLGSMEQSERQLLAEHILKEYPDLIDTAVLDGDGETAAQFQNRCAQLALARFWAEKVISTNGHDRPSGQKLNGRSCATVATGNGAMAGCMGGRSNEGGLGF